MVNVKSILGDQNHAPALQNTANVVTVVQMDTSGPLKDTRVNLPVRITQWQCWDADVEVKGCHLHSFAEVIRQSAPTAVPNKQDGCHLLTGM